MSAQLRIAAKMMAERLKLFRQLAQDAREREDVIELKPDELWEASDQFALDAYETALNQINGARPLPME